MQLPSTSGFRPSDVRARIADAFVRTVGPEDDQTRAWARDYLRDTSAATTLRIITNLDALRFAVTSSNSWDRRAPTACHTSLPSAANLNDFDGKADYMIVPHISLGSLSAGAIISRHAISYGKMSGQPGGTDQPGAEYRVGRYVRDEEKGDMLAMEHHSRQPLSTPGSSFFPSGRSVGWFMGCGKSTTMRQRLYFSCDMQRFCNGDLPDCVEWCAASDEMRPCYVCQTLPDHNGAALCECPFPSLKPANPTDWELAPMAMRLHVGVFKGRTRLLNRLMRGTRAHAATGTETVTDPLVSQVNIRGFVGSSPLTSATHEKLASILQNFAVQTSMNDCNPARIVMPAVGEPGFVTTCGLEGTAAEPVEKRMRYEDTYGLGAVGTIGCTGNSCGGTLATMDEYALYGQAHSDVITEANASLKDSAAGQKLLVGPSDAFADDGNDHAIISDMYFGKRRSQLPADLQLQPQSHFAPSDRYFGQAQAQLHLTSSSAYGSNMAVQNDWQRKDDRRDFSPGYEAYTHSQHRLVPGNGNRVSDGATLSELGVNSRLGLPGSYDGGCVGERRHTQSGTAPAEDHRSRLDPQPNPHLCSKSNFQSHNFQSGSQLHLHPRSSPQLDSYVFPSPQLHSHRQPSSQLQVPPQPSNQQQAQPSPLPILQSHVVQTFQETSPSSAHEPPLESHGVSKFGSDLNNSTNLGVWSDSRSTEGSENLCNSQSPGCDLAKSSPVAALDVTTSGDVLSSLAFAVDSYIPIAEPSDENSENPPNANSGQADCARSLQNACLDTGILVNQAPEAATETEPEVAGAEPSEAATETQPKVVGTQPARRPRGPKIRTPEEEFAREEKRKKKNRASAARSNARRKEKNDGLKSQLSTWKKKQEEVQNRFSELYRENMALKKGLREKNGVFYVRKADQ